MKDLKTQSQISPLTDPHKSNLGGVLGLNIRFNGYRSKRARLPLSKCSVGLRNSIQTTSYQSGQSVNGILERWRSFKLPIGRYRLSVLCRMLMSIKLLAAGGPAVAPPIYIKRYVSGRGWRAQIVDRGGVNRWKPGPYWGNGLPAAEIATWSLVQITSKSKWL
jgi:hypothetical protein